MGAHWLDHGALSQTTTTRSIAREEGTLREPRFARKTNARLPRQPVVQARKRHGLALHRSGRRIFILPTHAATACEEAPNGQSDASKTYKDAKKASSDSRAAVWSAWSPPASRRGSVIIDSNERPLFGGPTEGDDDAGDPVGT